MSVAYTDLASAGAGAVVTSIARPFVAGDVNMVLPIASGTNFTPGRYRVASVAAGAATLNTACCTGVGANGVGTLGQPFTTKASGNWNAAGQTTWNEVGIPGDLDTATGTNAAHAITVNVNTTVGGSWVAGTLAVDFSLGVLTVAAGVVFTPRGDIQIGDSSLTLGAGYQILWDSSISGANYKFLWGRTGFTGQATKLVSNGTALNPGIIDNAPGSTGRWYSDRWNVSSTVTVGCRCTYTQFNNGGDNAGARFVLNMSVGHASSEFYVDHCQFNNVGFISSPAVTAANDLVFTFNEITATFGYSQLMYFSNTATTTGLRVVTDNVFPVAMLPSAMPSLYFFDNTKGFTMERNIFGNTNATSYTGTAAMASFKDNIFIRSITGLALIGGNGDNLQYTYVAAEGGSAAAMATIVLPFTGTCTYDGWIIDSAGGTDEGDLGHMSAVPSGAVVAVMNRWLTLPNASLDTPGKTAAHGNYGIAMRYTKSTLMFGENILGVDTGRNLGSLYWGSGYIPRTDMIQMLQDNLAWSTRQVHAPGDYIGNGNNIVEFTGTVDSGSTTTLTDANPSPGLFSTGGPGFAASGAIPGATVVITVNGSGTGPAPGEFTTIQSLSGNTITFASALTAAVDSLTQYRIISYAPVTAANANHNAVFNGRNGNVKDKVGNITSVLSMSGINQINPATFMLDTINLGTGTDYTTAGPMFRDATRNWATLSRRGYPGGVQSAAFGCSAWALAQTVAVGDFRKNSNAIFFGGVEVWYRAIQAHNTSTANTEPGGALQTTAGGAAPTWAGYWELATSYDARVFTLAGTRFADSSLHDYDESALTNASIGRAASAWVRYGMMPTNPLIRTQASDGSQIGAVPYWSPTPATPTKLGVTGQPTVATNNVIFSTNITIAVQDAGGSTVITDTSSVSLVLNIVSGIAFLSGTTTRAAVAGIATFNDLQVNCTNGATFTITAFDGTLTSATTALITGSASGGGGGSGDQHGFTRRRMRYEN